MRILYVEDEKILAGAVVHLLKNAKIDVDWVENGEEALKMIQKSLYDCLVLDVMLPGISGLEVLEIIREQNNNTPVIMLSALGEVEDKIKGLEKGADDYLAKPFKTAELIARIKAVSRRPHLVASKTLEYEDLRYDVETRILNDIQLTEKEGLIFELLIKNPEKIQNKSQILSYVWGYDASGDDNYVEVYISYLRRTLKQLGSKTSIITIRNLGYKLTKNV